MSEKKQKLVVEAWLNCSKCTHRYAVHVPKCPKCQEPNIHYDGAQVTTEKRCKSLAITLVLAFIGFGLGHLYIRKFKRGLLIMGCGSLIFIVVYAINQDHGVMFGIAMNFMQVVDAYRVFKRTQ